EIIFIRHAHGEHLLDYPNQLNTLHPGLTEYGVYQINQLRNQILVQDDDLIIVSPTKRTIQTAEKLSQTNNFYISPMVGPRMYPQDPHLPSLLCDQIYTGAEILDVVEERRILDFGLTDWREGINRIKRSFIISHDGTIT